MNKTPSKMTESEQMEYAMKQSMLDTGMMPSQNEDEDLLKALAESEKIITHPTELKADENSSYDEMKEIQLAMEVESYQIMYRVGQPNCPVRFSMNRAF